MKLYCFGQSGNAYKAALTMELAGVDWEPVFVDFFNGEARTPEFQKINAMGEVPVLIDGDQTITQSGVMQYHVARLTGKFDGKTQAEKDEVLRWVLWDNHKMSSQVGPTRFVTNFLPEDKRPEQVIGWLQGRIKAAFVTLNNALEGRDWLVGDGITLADIACCSYLYYPEEFGFDRKDYPNINAWLDRIAAQPGWKHPYDLMPTKEVVV